jgi:HupE / UreJ protein
MSRAVSLVLLVSPAFGHVMSISSGDLTVTGDRGHYELRMPLYELTHMRDPSRSIFQNIHFSSGGRAARLVASDCRSNEPDATYFCTADYQFAAPPDRIDVACTFHSITVPNHVHLLRAYMDGKNDQAVFDLSFSRATLRFRPPTPLETAITQSGGGFIRAWGGPVQILFLAALVLAGRSAKELLVLTAMFLAGQAVSVWIAPHLGWQPAPRFVEAATALTVAYLAVEILLLPEAGMRWFIAAVLGAFHGLYFHLFLQSTGYRPALVLSGAAIAQVLATAAIGFAFARLSRVAPALRPLQVSACGLLAFGMIWFLLRLRS